MRFAVPQFIDVEDKLFGPLTFKQFVYIVGGVGLIFVAWKALPTFFALLLIVPIGALTWALAFYKVNNKPFIDVLQSAFNYFLRDKLYIWRKESKKKKEEEKKENKTPQYIPTMTGSRLHDISWGLDVLDMKRDE